MGKTDKELLSEMDDKIEKLVEAEYRGFPANPRNKPKKIIRKTMNKTAVGWLINEIENKNGKEFSSYYTEFIQQALELEKQQIIDAYKQGQYDGDDMRETDAEQYYDLIYKNITYGSK